MNGTDVNAAMVAAGPAWVYLQYSIPAYLLAAYPVSTAVNKPSQGELGLIEPL